MAVKFKVPHDKDGNQVSWGAAYKGDYETDPYEFDGRLMYYGFSRGRSALNIHWKDIDTGKFYTSGMQMLDRELSSNQVSRIDGRFGFKKQGTSILLVRICSGISKKAINELRSNQHTITG
jgi:hypothetical protein